MKLLGVCHQCKEYGHGPSRCPTTRHKRPSATILSLPTELWEIICRYIVDEDPRWRRIWTFLLWDLRLSCKTINHKINDYYARSAFKWLSVHVDLQGFERLKNVSEHSLFASKVEVVSIHEYNRHHGEWRSYLDDFSNSISSENTSRERREARAHMRNARIEQDEKDFIERSGADSIAVAMAFQRFPNLREVDVSCGKDDRPSIWQHLAGSSYTTTRAFSMLASCLPYAVSSITRLGTWGFGSNQEQGISIQALALPPTVLNCFASLQHLDIRVQTADQSYRNPVHWQYHLADFLGACYDLRCLKLSFRNDWKDTEAIFKHVAERVAFPDLADLTLTYIRCSGADLRLFLDNHRVLKKLSLRDLDITGNVPFRDVLTHVGTELDKLTSFKCRQIAENSFRLYFPNLGDMNHDTNPTSWLRMEDETDFFDDFVYVRYSKYEGSAEPWEGVTSKIVELANDVSRTTLSYHPEMDFGFYRWSD